MSLVECTLSYAKVWLIEPGMESRNVEKFIFQTPCTCMLIGPTGCGKSSLMSEIIDNRDRLFSSPVSAIFWFFNSWQDLYEKYKNTITFLKGLESLEKCLQSRTDPSKHVVYIVDDLLESINEVLSKLFTQYSHHLNISVFFLSQVIFPKNTIARTLSVNSHYIILFKNKRDSLSITRLASQIYPSQSREFSKLYKRLTAGKYSYLLMDFSPNNIDPLAVLRSGILPHNLEKIFVLD